MTAILQILELIVGTWALLFLVFGLIIRGLERSADRDTEKRREARQAQWDLRHERQGE